MKLFESFLILSLIIVQINSYTYNTQNENLPLLNSKLKQLENSNSLFTQRKNYNKKVVVDKTEQELIDQINNLNSEHGKFIKENELTKKIDTFNNFKNFMFKSTLKSNSIGGETELEPIIRKAEDGRFCAKSFVQDGKTYTDCTKANLPTGSPTDREWCYLSSEYDSKESLWAFCMPILNFNKVRQHNYDQLRIVTKITTLLDMEIKSNVGPAQNTIESASQIKISQRELSNNINILKEQTKELKEKIKKNNDAKSERDSKEQELKDLTFKIDSLTQDMDSQKGNENLKNNCEGMLLYEDVPQGDGLKAFYYDNESWMGDPIEGKDEKIFFDWTGTSPLKGINPHNFSVIWEGYIVPPYTGEYFFTLHADNGGILIANDKVIISHNNGSITDKKKNKIVNLNNPSSGGKKLDPFISKSKGITFIGENKVKIKLAYFHSIHYTPFKDIRVFAKLQWESDEFQLRDIITNDLFSVDTLPPLKVTDYDTENAVLRKIREGDDFFKDSSRYIIQDITVELDSTGNKKI